MCDVSTTQIACPKCHEYFLCRQTLKVNTSNIIWNTYVCPGCGFVHAAESDEDMQKYADDYSNQVLFSERKTDYHAKQDYGKAKLTLVPRRILWDVAAIREYGNNKYPEGGPDNWKAVEVDRYRDATFRHLSYYLDDPYGVDKESGFPHLWHLACNIAFLCEMEDMYLSKNPEVVERLKKEFGGKDNE